VELLDLITGVRQYLSFSRDMGMETLDLSPGTRTLMEAWASPRPLGGQSPLDRIPGASGWLKGEGNPEARLVFVCRTGPGPGAASLYASAAGDLFVNVLKAMTLTPGDVFLVSFASRGEGDAGQRGTLRRLVASIRPDCVSTLGDAARGLLLGPGVPPLPAGRGFRDLAGIPVMVTLHPDDLVRDPSLKRFLWEDVKQIMARLDLGGRS
jgi:DNA polymerase